jgi:hypothetical protein
MRSRFNVFLGGAVAKVNPKILFFRSESRGLPHRIKGIAYQALNAEYYYLYGVDSFVKRRAKQNQNF